MADTGEHVVDFALFGVQVVDVPRGDHRQAQAVGQAHQVTEQAHLAGVVVALHFDEEVLRPEDARIALRDLQRRVVGSGD